MIRFIIVFLGDILKIKVAEIHCFFVWLIVCLFVCFLLWNRETNCTFGNLKFILGLIHYYWEEDVTIFTKKKKIFINSFIKYITGVSEDSILEFYSFWVIEVISVGLPLFQNQTYSLTTVMVENIRRYVS